jgi:Uma2 family endonuclease
MTTQLDTTRSYTVEEFMSLPDDGKRYELIEGELIEMPGPNLNHGIITSQLIRALSDFLKSQGQSPDLALTNLAFELASKTGPIPDVAFVMAERMAGADLSKAFPGPPDLAIEVMSPTDKWSEVIAKVKLYQRYQTRLVWIVDPFDQSIFVYHLNQNRRSLLAGDELTGDDVLPGFTLPVRALFD